MKADPGGRAV